MWQGELTVRRHSIKWRFWGDIFCRPHVHLPRCVRRKEMKRIPHRELNSRKREHYIWNHKSETMRKAVYLRKRQILDYTAEGETISSQKIIPYVIISNLWKIYDGMRGFKETIQMKSFDGYKSIESVFFSCFRLLKANEAKEVKYHGLELLINPFTHLTE